MNALFVWSWVFLAAYIAAMIGLGVYASRRVKSGDDYAVARQSYGPLMLAFAFAATTASGATFLGIPGLAYKLGVSALWYAFCYPIGVYIGVLLCLNAVAKGGNEFGSRSIPEYLGDRFDSDFIRLAFSLFSLILLFYLAGQLVAGLVMFEQLLGLSKFFALALTTIVLLVYVVMGGAHADIITDGVQGFAMLLIAILVAVLFLSGIEVAGEHRAVVDVLNDQDSDLLRSFIPSNAVFASPLTIAGIVIAHIPLGMLPHIGNKLWALKSDKDRKRFVGLAFVFAMVLPAMVLGGLLARAVLGDQLLGEGFSPNESIPAVFIELMPTWLAALLSVAILSAIMSTADGLVVSASQVFANDIYRRTLAPRIHAGQSTEQLDQRVLSISRWSTVLVLIAAATMAWALMGMNVALIVWIGIGGMTSAMAGPLLLGSQWSAVNRAGAIAGMLTGVATFILLHTKLLATLLSLSPDAWLTIQSGNPYTCSAIGAVLSVVMTAVVSVMTQSSPK